MEEEILAYALQNAIDHGGKANLGSVMGRAMALYPDLRKDPRSASILVKKIVDEVNCLDPKVQVTRLNGIGGPRESEKRERKTGLPDLEGAIDDKVVMRFAPGPSGPLHIGHTRASILNDEYCRRYKGKFLLRIEDTNPEKIDPDAYKMIPQDLDWLGINIHETYVQSERFELYYHVSKKLIENGNAYVCTEDTEVWRELKLKGYGCRERDQPVEDQLERWERMLDGTYAEGEASLVIKTDLKHKNPAVRDFVGMRIRDMPHPRTGDRYRVYPLYNLSVSIDDHEMNCSHILRGKDHLNNTYRQEYVFEHLGWEKPVFIHYGLVSIPDTLLKTSLIRNEILKGNFSGWDDVRLGTLRALSARGFDPASLRNYWKDVGLKSVDITFSWENLYAMNRSIIDRSSNRYFFVEDPVKIQFKHEIPLKARIPLHPEVPGNGFREHVLVPNDGMITLFVPSDDLRNLPKGAIFRLKDLCNIKATDPANGSFEYAGQDISLVRGSRGRIFQWVPLNGIELKLRRPNGSISTGIAERAVEDQAKSGNLVQFERVGYCKTNYDNGVWANFTHP